MKSFKPSVKFGIKFVLFSTLLSVVYSNCARTKFEPYSAPSTKLNGSNVEICSNGASNYPTCTTTTLGSCVNGNTNPPACTTGGNSSCSNGAVNYPTCSLTSSNTCINGTYNPPDCNSFNSNMTCPNGAVNYPDCTVTSSNICINGATNPPTCDIGGSAVCSNGASNYPDCTTDANNICLNGSNDPPACVASPVSRVFDVIKKVSGSLSSYSVSIDMQFNEADINKKGAIFLVAQTANTFLVCTNPCTKDSAWKEWSNTTYDWSVSGLKTNVGVASNGVVGLQTVLKGLFDVTPYGGFKLYAGYGLGNTVNTAINEMLGYRSASLPNGRYLEVLTIPIQNLSISITGPKGGSPGSMTNYDLWANIAPSYLDYGKPGFYFVVAYDATNTPKKIYRQVSTGVYEWVDWSGTAATAGSNYYKYDLQIKNESFNIFKGDISVAAGWSVYAGYGNGNNSIEAANDCFNNLKFNTNPFIVK